MGYSAGFWGVGWRDRKKVTGVWKEKRKGKRRLKM